MLLLDPVPEHNELLVMSVYNKASMPWLPLQKQFLDSTTKLFDFAVFLNHADSSEFPKDVKVIGTNKEKCKEGLEHLLGLKELLRYAKTTDHKYHLILDSDCFPIVSNWQTILNNRIEHYNAASVIRTENCSTFPHPCVCYFEDPDQVDFAFKTCPDLRGVDVNDVACLLDNPFPLLRTNRRNRHLLASAIYFDLFYHHGCGSRDFCMRGFEYYHSLNKDEDPGKLRQELFENPTKFLKTLTNP